MHSSFAWGLLLASNLLLAADEVESLDTEFLEFLGLWETEQGEWLPPTEVAKLQLDDDVAEDVDKEKSEEVVDED